MHTAFAEQLDEQLSSIFAMFGIPAAVAVAVKCDQTFVKTHGFKQIGGHEPIGPDTVFSIASCSKAFCATLAAALVDDGIVGWDDRIADTVPEFIMDDPWITREIRLRDVLGMRTGLKREGACEYGFHPDRPCEDYFPTMRHVERIAGFRTQMTYMNAGYAAAAKLLERRAGQSYSDLLSVRLLEPAGMSHAVSCPGYLGEHPDHFLPHVRLGEEIVALPDPLCVGWEGSSCVYLSANDAARWLRFQLDEGMVSGHPVVSRAAIGETRKPHAPDSPGPHSGEHLSLYTLGWQAFDYHGRLVFRHTGSELGASTMTIFCPEEKLGVACFVNLYSSAGMAAAYQMLDHFLGVPEKGWAELAQQTLAKRVDDAISDVETRFPADGARTIPADIEGRYTSRIYGDALIQASEHELRLIIADRPMLNASLIPVGDSVFDIRHDYVGMEQELYGRHMRLAAHRSGSRTTHIEHSLFSGFERVHGE